MRKFIALVISASVLTIALTTTVFACGGLGKNFKSLNLSDDQREQVSVFMEQNKAGRKIFKEKMQVLKKQRHELMDNYSDSLAMEVATQAGELQKLKSLARIEHFQRVLSILTDEQKVKFKSLIEKRKHHKAKHDDDDGEHLT